MKLQYLGDVRDSFKWDLLHHLVVDAGFEGLYYVPFLTQDDDDRRDGQIPPHRFPCRDEILRFNQELRGKEDLNLIKRLGSAVNGQLFDVEVFKPERYVGIANKRQEYLADFKPELLKGTLVFFDPDNGFETVTQKSVKWVRHDEICRTLMRVPEDSAVVVYQHKPRRKWVEFLTELRERCVYSPLFVAVYESNLSFAFLCKEQSVFQRLRNSIDTYVAGKNGVVKVYSQL